MKASVFYRVQMIEEWKSVQDHLSFKSYLKTVVNLFSFLL